MECPRCDGQGRIYKALLPDLGIIIYACIECDACWQEGEEISINKFADLSTFLKDNGLAYGVSKIEKLGFYWEK